MPSTWHDGAFVSGWTNANRRNPRRWKNPASYAKWRSGIPFTDDMIASALEAEAAALHVDATVRREYLLGLAVHARKGLVTREACSVAYSRLVTKCHACDRKATYRSGSAGACRAHQQKLKSMNHA